MTSLNWHFTSRHTMQFFCEAVKIFEVSITYSEQIIGSNKIHYDFLLEYSSNVMHIDFQRISLHIAMTIDFRIQLIFSPPLHNIKHTVQMTIVVAKQSFLWKFSHTKPLSLTMVHTGNVNRISHCIFIFLEFNANNAQKHLKSPKK